MMTFILATDFDFIAHMSKMAFFEAFFTPVAFLEYDTYMHTYVHTYIDRFADDIALLPNAEQAQLLLSPVETSAKQIILHINNCKTEYIKFSQGKGDPKALSRGSLKDVDDFLYLGSWTDYCSKDLRIEKA